MMLVAPGLSLVLSATHIKLKDAEPFPGNGLYPYGPAQRKG